MKKYLLTLLLLLSAAASQAQIRYVEPFGGLYFGWPVVTGDFPDMDLSRSHDFCLDMVRLSFPVGGNENIRFRVQARWEFFSLGSKYYKMKFHYAGVPVGFTFRRGLFKFGLQCTPLYKVYARTKDKSFERSVVERLDGVNPFRLTGEMSFSFAFIGFFGRYSATPIFSRGYYREGGNARLVTFGIAVDL